MAAGGVLVGRGYVSIRPEFEGDWSRSVNTRASSAGRSGGGAFSKAFGAAVSGGLRGVLGGFGASLAAGIAPAGAAIAALAPALATAGAAAGALKLGLSGVGDAFKAAFANTSADASKAASATKAVEAAQRGLANAQRALAQARVDAAQRVADAEKQVESAERDLTDAQRNARDVQADLNSARQEAARALEDMNNRLADARLNEREAVLRQQEAEKELKAAQANPGTTPEELAKLQLAYDRAAQALKEQQTETKRLASDTAQANKAGVEGSQQVVDAKQKISDANRAVQDKEQALADAQAGVDRARQDGLRQIADAQRQVAEAAQAVADAQQAASSQTSKLDQAMAKLAPNAQSFVKAVQGLAPAWDRMRLSVQNALFQGLDGTVRTLAGATLPTLQKRLTDTGGIWNSIAKSAAGAITDMGKSGMLDTILKGANDNLRVFKDTPKQIITAFGQLTVAAQPAFNGLLKHFAGAIKSFTDGIAKSFKNGGLKSAIDTAFQLIGQLGHILGDAAVAVTNILKAAGSAGGQALSVVGALFKQIRQVTEMPEIQAALKTIFKSIAQIVGALAPVIGSILQAAVPLIAAIAPIVAQLAQTLGPVLQQVVTALGKALMPIITALGPVIGIIGDAIGQIVTALVPLLQPIGELIGAIITALLPVLKPIIAIVVQLVDVLVGPLKQIIQALIPFIGMLGKLFGQVFGALAPIITPLVGIVGQLAGVFAQVATLLIGTLIQAITPLIPVFVQIADLVVQLATQVLASLMPSLNQLIMAGVHLFVALLPLLPTLLQLTGMLLTLAVKVLSVVLPPLIKLAGWLTGQLVDALTTVIGWVTKLITWLVGNLGPAFKSLRDLGIAAWGKLRDGISAAWEGVKTYVLYPVRDFFTKTVPGWATTVKDKVVGAFDAMKDGIGKAWDKIKGLTKAPINFVIGTIWNKGLVDTVWKKITDWIPGLPKLGHIPLLAQGGTLPVQPGVFNSPTAIVGEGNPAHPEFVIPTDPRYRGRALSLWQAAGTQLLAGGGIIGDIIGGVKSIGSKVGGFFSSAASFLAHPGKALDDLFGKLLKPLQDIKDSSWGKLALALPKAILGGLKDLVSFGGGGDIGGSIPKGQRLAVISQALAAAGVPPPGTLPQWQAGLNTLITRESGWNPRAINLWDSNAAAGHPSQGLAQTIPGTFNAYAPAPLRSRGILDPVANVAAAIRYIVSRYGNITNVQQANAHKPPAGYDSGGWLQPGVTTAVNATGKPEAVLTGAQWQTMTAVAANGLQAGDKLRLVVADYEFTAYVDARADGRVQAGNQRLIQVLNAN